MIAAVQSRPRLHSISRRKTALRLSASSMLERPASAGGRCSTSGSRAQRTPSSRAAARRALDLRLVDEAADHVHFRRPQRVEHVGSVRRKVDDRSRVDSSEREQRERRVLGPPRHRLPRLEARGAKELERARAGAGVADAGARDADVAVGQRRAAAADGQRDVRPVLGLLAQAVDDAALRRERLALGLGHHAVVRAIDRDAERHGSGRGERRLRLRRRDGARRHVQAADRRDGLGGAKTRRRVHARVQPRARGQRRRYTRLERARRRVRPPTASVARRPLPPAPQPELGGEVLATHGYAVDLRVAKAARRIRAVLVPAEGVA